MRPTRACAALGTLLLAGCATARDARLGSTTQAGASQCVPASDERAADARYDYGSLLADTSTVAAEFRAEWGVPPRDLDDVTIVEDRAECRLAAQRFAAVAGAPDSAFRVIVLRFAHVRVVSEPVEETEVARTGVNLDVIFSADYSRVIAKRWN